MTIAEQSRLWSNSTRTIVTSQSCRGAGCAYVLLVLFTCIFFWQPIFTGKVFYLGDHAAGHVPMYVTNARLRAEGEIPLWNRHGVLGFPTQAENELSGVYPPSLIFNAVHDVGTAYTVYILFHYLVGLAATMYLAGVVGTGMAGQAMAALVFVFGGSFTSFTYTFTLLGPFAWTPLILGLLLRAIATNRFGPAVFAGLVLAIQASGAHPHTIFFSLLLLVLAIVHQFRGPERWQHVQFAIRAGVVVLVVGLGLSAPQISYSLEYLVTSARGSGLAYERQTMDSLPPHYLVQLLIPNSLGGDPLTHFRLNEMRLYVGLLSWSLIVLGWRASPDKPFIPLLRTMLIGSLVLALGRFGGVYVLLAQLPGFRQIHHPDRFLLLFSLAAALFVGLGTDRLLRGELDYPRARKWVVGTYGLIAMITFAVWLVAFFGSGNPRAAFWYESIANFGLTQELPIEDPLSRLSVFTKSAATATIVALLCMVFWLLLPKVRRQSVAASILGVILAADLLIANIAVNHFGPGDIYSRVPPILEPLRDDTSLWRIWQPHLDWYEVFATPGPLPVIANSAALHQVDSINCMTGADEWRWRQFWMACDIKQMGMYNVKYISVLVDLPLPERARDGEMRVYENPYFQPRVSVREQIAVASLEDDVAELINSPDFPLAEGVVIDEAPRFLEGQPIPQPPAKASVSIVHYGAHRVELDVVLPRPGILVLSDLHYRGWQAESNGRPVKILRANGLVRGLALGPGQHQVQFIYQPQSFYRGLYITAAVVAVLVIWSARLMFAPSDRAQPDSAPAKPAR